jgi:hypothetical protein
VNTGGRTIFLHHFGRQLLLAGTENLRLIRSRLQTHWPGRRRSNLSDQKANLAAKTPQDLIAYLQRGQERQTCTRWSRRGIAFAGSDQERARHGRLFPRAEAFHAAVQRSVSTLGVPVPQVHYEFSGPASAPIEV